MLEAFLGADYATPYTQSATATWTAYPSMPAVGLPESLTEAARNQSDIPANTVDPKVIEQILATMKAMRAEIDELRKLK